MTDATPVYRAIMLECERRRVALGIGMEKFSEFAGLPDRYISKAIYADKPSGRQASWATLQVICDALWPDGFDVIVKPKVGAKLDALKLSFQVKYEQAMGDGKTRRQIMSEIGKKGAEALKKVRLTKIGKRRRRQIARHAALARHSKKKNPPAMPSQSTG